MSKKQQLDYDPPAGTHIKKACEEASAMALKQQRSIRFDFNGITLIAQVGSNAKQLEETYYKICEESRQGFAKSPEGIKQAEDLRLETETRQLAVDSLIAELSILFTGGLDPVVSWCKEMAIKADWTGVKFDHSAVLKKFSDAGYVTNYGVGFPKERFQDRDTMGRYIVGQCMSAFAINMPPHPIAITFADKYFNLPKST